MRIYAGITIVAAAALVAAATAVASPAEAAAAPTVAGISPSGSALAGGDRVTVSGTGFKHVKKVLFGSKAGTHLTTSSVHKLTVTAPAHGAGTVHVRVVTAAGKSAKNGPGDKFAYVGAPKITGITPSTGDPAGDVHVEINGENLRDVQTVTVGGQPALVSATSPPIVPNNGRHILASVPPMAEGSYDVVVTTAYGTTTPGANSKYHYVGSPQWQFQDPPPPGTTSGTNRFYDVDCRTGTCYAIGSHGTSVDAKDDTPLLDVRQHDGSWTQVDVSPPSGTDSFTDAELLNIACSTEGTCLIQGIDLDGSDGGTAFDVIGSGSDWTTTHAPELQPDRSESALACGGDRCALFGEVTTNSTTKVAAAVWSGGSWTIHHGPALKTRHGIDWGPAPSMTCPTATKCMAVDTYGKHQMIAVHIPMTGSGDLTVDYLPWQPFDPEHAATVTKIACASNSSCVAIGTEFTPNPSDDPPDPPAYSFLERYQHGAWTEKHFALPTTLMGKHATTDWNGFDIDCASTGTCYVVGRLSARWKDSNKHVHTKQAATVTRVDETGQTSKFAAVPDQYVGTSSLSNVFCGVHPTCVALGGQQEEQVDGPTQFTAFTLRLDTSDRPQIFTGPHFDEGEPANGRTSCSGPGDCVEVGSLLFQDGSGDDTTLRYQGWIFHS